MSRVQQMVENTPTWANWVVITGTALLSWIQPIAGAVAILWGGIQIFTWVRKEVRDWKSKRKGS